MSMATKINALLTKAESTEFPEEAEALTAKAMSLMAIYAIDEALLSKARGDTEAIDNIETRIVIVPNPYSMERLVILQQVSNALGGYVYFFPQARDGMKVATNSKDHNTKAGVIGYPSDIDNIETMFQSLIKQEGMARNYAHRYEPIPGGMGRKKVWNKSFIRAFAYRIGGRLVEVMQHEIDVHEESGSVALAIQGKQEAIDAEVASRGFKRYKGSAQHSQAGADAGYVAGDRASLSHELDR